jgi:hypothetical protein
MRLTLAVLAVLVVAPATASAYPQFQLSLEVTRCGDCHLSPAGGGLLDQYGRDEAGTTISRGGDGRFLHGLWEPPDWLALGGDGRFAVADRYLQGEHGLLGFPMQTELAAHATKGSFSVTMSVGLRGVAHTTTSSAAGRLVSREHYASYEVGEFLARAGRFYPVFGLRLPDHTAFVRRHMNMYLFEEPYGVELARYEEHCELHVTAFVPQPSPYLGAGVPLWGIAALLERTIAQDSAILGWQFRAAFSDEDARYAIGSLAKWYLEGSKLLVLAELDLQSQVFQRATTAGSRAQLAGYLGVSRWLARGLLGSAALHLWEPDLFLEGTTRTAADVTLQLFPRAHWELQLLGRISGEGDYDWLNALALLQLHYYL